MSERRSWFAILRDKKTRVFISGSGTLRIQHKIDPYPWGEERWGEEVDLWTFDLKSNDREYWRRVRCFLQWLAPYVDQTSWAHATYKELRRRMFAGQAKDWDQVLPRPVRDWAYSKLEELQRDCDFVDNSRVARKGNTAQVRRYKRQRDNGCCGFHDSEAVCPIDGKTYLLGFNFGH